MLDTLQERDRLLPAALAAGWICIALLVATAIWIAVQIFWRLLESGQPPTPVTTVAGQAALGGTTSAVDIASLHLFGQSGIAATNQTFDAPETSLDLVLVGTLAADQPDAGMAIVAHSEGDGFYQVGDELPGDATLHEVHTDRVVLVHQGRFETLRLREETASGQSRRRPVARRPMASTGPTNLGNTPATTGINWQQVQQNLRIDPRELAREVRALPQLENGRQIGVRLQAGRDTLLFSKLGLRNTDIITSVNQVPLDSPGRALELLNQLSSQTQFTVRLKRDGRDMTLNIDANQLAR